MTISFILEKMKAHSYTAIPVITKEGLYIGSLSEGDFLWHIVDHAHDIDGIDKCENYKVKNMIRPEWMPAVTINVDMETLIERAGHQNYIPVTDDRGYFIGIVTRGRIIETFCSTQNAKKSQQA